MKISRPLRGVVHLQFPSQKNLCSTFVRMQEFYESPYPEIRGQVFTLATYKALYCADHGKPFSYFTDWPAFNIPVKVLKDFARKFKGQRTHSERVVLRACEGAEYVIATFQKADVEHELAHAMFYIDPYYRARASMLVARQTGFSPALARLLSRWLIREGYHEDVLIEEMNAYLATNEVADWEETFQPATSHALFGMGYELRREFERNKKYLMETEPEYQKCLILIDRQKGVSAAPAKPSRGAKARRHGTIVKPSTRAPASRMTAP